MDCQVGSVLLVEVILPRLTEDIPMNMQHSTPMTPLRARMIADMSARNLGPASQVGHLRACKRFAAWLGRSPETAEPDDIKHFQQHLIETGTSICTRNRTMTGVKFLFRVTLRRHDLVAEIFSLKEPVKVPLVLSRNEVKRILLMAPSLKARVMLSLAYGCGMRAGEVVRLKVGDIDGEQKIIRIVQSKGRKDRNVMLPGDILGLLRDWWKERPPGKTRAWRDQIASSSPAITANTCHRARSRGCSSRRPRRRASPNRSRSTRSSIPSPHICWNVASTSGSYRRCWGIPN